MAYLRVGSASLDITPHLGISMAGYYHDRRAEGVLDPLSAKALMVTDGERKWTLVSCDLLGLPGWIVNQVRESVNAKLGLYPDEVMICCTHTHTGPVVSDAPFAKPDEFYLEFLKKRLVDVIVMASRNLVEAEAFAGRGKVEGIAFNRRYRMKDGSVLTNPGVNNPNIVEPVGPVDPEFGVLLFRDKVNGRIIGLVANYALHADVIGGNLISPDYPGYFAKRLQHLVGQEFPVLFTRGSAGDINHINVHPRQGSQKGLELSRAIGRILAAEAIQMMDHSEKAECVGNIWCNRMAVDLPLRSISDEEVKDAEDIINRESDSTREGFMRLVKAIRILRLAKLGTALRSEVQALGLGDVVFVGWPGEVFVEIGLTLKGKSKISFTWVVDLANDSVGYIPCEKAYGQGSYEVTSTIFAPQTGEILVNAALDLIAKRQA